VRRLALGATALLLSLCGVGLLDGAEAALARAHSSPHTAHEPQRPLTGFLSQPTDQVAVPGEAGSGEVTPEGDLYTGWAEYRLSVGGPLQAWDQPTRTLPNPSLPLLSSSLHSDGVEYTLTVFAVPVDGRPVAYESVVARNGSDRRQHARVSMAIAYTQGEPVQSFGGPTTAFRYARPVQPAQLGSYEQPGQAFSEAFSYSFDGRDIDRSGLLLARGPRAGGSPVATPLEPSSQTAPNDQRIYVATLRPHRKVRFTWQIPLDPPAAGAEADSSLDSMPLPAARAALVAFWQRQEATMTRIDVPERKVSATYDAAMTQILQSRLLTSVGWMQMPNRLQYQAFWIRDAAIATDALDLAGLHLQAEQNLAFFSAFQEPNGLFISQSGQYDELGQALWAIGEHAELTRDPAYAAAQLPALTAAIQWLQNASESDPLGLLPAADPKDNEMLYGHITGDDLWAVDGLREAVDTARLAGQEALAQSWQQIDERFEVSLDDAIESAFVSVGHIPPALDQPGGQDWGNYGASFPEQVLSPGSPAVVATLAWGAEHSIDGIPTYGEGAQLQGYLGFRLFETYLAAGERGAAVAGLYAELAHTTSSDEGWELIAAPPGPRASKTDLAPHITFAAEYVAMLRNMLVREAPNGAIELLAGASPAWLAPREHVTVTRAPTDLGTISFTERSTRHGESLTWSGNVEPGTPVLWVLPPWAQRVRVAGARAGRVLTLHGRSGSLHVTFSGHRPQQSYADAVAALDRSYRADGEAAPIVPAKTALAGG
jgi:hypothetical protein